LFDKEDRNREEKEKEKRKMSEKRNGLTEKK